MKQVITYDTVDDTLLKKWHKLWNDSSEGHFFNTPEWFFSYCETYGVRKQQIVTIEENGELILVLPLVLEKVFGISTWVSPGGKFLNKSSLLMKTTDKQALVLLLKQITRLGSVYLRELSEEYAEVIVSIDNNFIKQDASSNPYLPLAKDTIEQLSPKLSSQIRNTLQKYPTELHFTRVRGDAAQLRKIFTLDALSSKAKQGKATFTLEKDRLFCISLLQRLPSQFVIDTLYFQKKPIIYSIGFTYKKTFEAFLTAYDAAYQQLRPGKLLTYFILKQLQQEQISLLDFSRGVSPLKLEFTKQIRKQYTVFHSENILISQWLVFANSLYNTILHSKMLYSTYLFFKKFVKSK